MVVGENNRTANIMDGIESTGDVRLHDHRLRLKQRFDIVRKLGQGTYGKVQLGINKKTGQEVAIKTIKKCKIESEADLVRIRREVQIMSSVRHPNIVHIYEVFENSEKMILVMEYCSGGELYDYLSKKKVLQEDEARRLFRQIATAVYYCHIHKICHRDLKLENVLIDDTGSAKIADFGLSNVFKETSLLSTFCGSPLYASPEIVKGTPYIGPEVDCWSLGVLLYTLVYGAMPFDGSNFKRLVRQISNGDYYEPKTPSTASPLIRDMLTVDPLKRADIAYICDHPWVNESCEASCLEVAEALAAETPVRLDLLLSLAPCAPSHSNSVVVPSENELGPEESCTDLTSSASMPVEPSNSAEKRILELVAEGGEDAIKPSPTRTIVSAGDNKRKLELAMSASGLQRKKERVASCASIAPGPVLPEEASAEDSPPAETATPEIQCQPSLKSSATITIQPSPSPTPAPTTPPSPPAQSPPIKKLPSYHKPKEPSEPPKAEETKQPAKKVVKKKISPAKSFEEKSSPEKQDEPKQEETKAGAVASAADKLTSLSLTQPPAPAPVPKPKKFSIPGGNVGSFKEQFERRASLTTPEVKRTGTKPVTSKIAKAKSQSEEREVPSRDAVRLQQIGIEPSPSLPDEQTGVPAVAGGVKKTESEPAHSSAPDPAVLLQDARRSLQSSMAKLVEERQGEDSRRRAARDVIASAIRTGKPPVPYGRSSSAGVTSLSTPPGTPPAAPPSAPPASAPRVFRTEVQHSVGDHRNRGVSVERIIPINVAPEDSPTPPTSPPAPAPAAKPAPGPAPAPAPVPAPATARVHQPLRRLVSSESNTSEASSPGEPIKKSAREFIIPIAVEGKGYVTPRQRSLEPEAARAARTPKTRRVSSLVSGGESEDEDDMHMHRLRSTRAARAESVSSGEEDEEDEGFHLLTAENLFSTLLHRVRALTNRLNGEEGPGLQRPHSLFNNLQSPFFSNSPHLPRRSLLREGWGSRDFPEFESMFNKRSTPRGNSKKRHARAQQHPPEQQGETKGLDLSDLDLSSIQWSEKEVAALSGLTPGLSRRLQRQLLRHLPPAAATQLRRTLSLQGPPRRPPERSLSASASASASPADRPEPTDCNDPENRRNRESSVEANALKEEIELPAPQIRNAQRPEINCEPGVERNETTDEIEHPASDLSKTPQTEIKLAPSVERNVLEENTEIPARQPRNTEQPDIILEPNVERNALREEIELPASRIYNTDRPEIKRELSVERNVLKEEIEIPVPQYCTLPRLKRHTSRETTPLLTEDYSRANSLSAREASHSRGSSMRSTPDRSLLSKYLTPERNLSLDETYTPDTGSILSEPSYIAAYGTPAIGSASTLGHRRHSMRLTSEQPRKRVSRFLRSDFFDNPRDTDESFYVKLKKEKELETQKILREIREKKNKSLDSPSAKSPTDSGDDKQMFKDDGYARKCLSPVSPISLLTGKERSRSNTPFYPILDKIKETTLDTSVNASESNRYKKSASSESKTYTDSTLNRESKILRPKSYPVKNLDSYEEPSENNKSENISKEDYQSKDKTLPRESKLLRPKSYPASSPSPEKVYVSRKFEKDDLKTTDPEKVTSPEAKNDIEVSFSISLPKKTTKSIGSPKVDTLRKNKSLELKEDQIETTNKVADSLVLKKYQVVKNDESNSKCHNTESTDVAKSKKQEEINKTAINEDTQFKIMNHSSNKEEVKLKPTEGATTESIEKKGTIKKKIIRKVSSKSKTDAITSQEGSDNTTNKPVTEKKKVTKKVKEKNAEDGTKTTTVTKKKSVLQSIGHKLEKLASNKSNSPEKVAESNVAKDVNKETKLCRTQREHSVPVSAEPPTESNLIKRAVTLTDVAALDSQTSTPSKTTVSKVLGLFRKFEPKDKTNKPVLQKALSESREIETIKNSSKSESITEPIAESLDLEKPKRPTSLLLNGLGRKNKYERAASDSLTEASLENEEIPGKKEINPKNIRNSLKLDFSRLPRVKKIVPTNPVIEPQIINVTDEKTSEKKDVIERNGNVSDVGNLPINLDALDTLSRSRSRSRSTYSNSEMKSDNSGDVRSSERTLLSPSEHSSHHPLRHHEPTSPDKEDVVERIRRKSFYSRFNEKKQRRKSNLVGPGATDYDPLARIHSPQTEPKFDLSPTSPVSYDLSPGYSVASDLSPSTERYRSLLNDLPTRNNSRYDNYGLNDKIDTYRSLDRNDFRKYPGVRSYLDYDQPSSYTSHRYSRTKSLLDSAEGNEDNNLGLRDPQKYNRTVSMYSPGNYATYRPKRTRNSAIILKESEKEPSPENILDKIRQRKNFSISVTKKPDSEKDAVSSFRSDISPKSQGDGAECSEKAD